MAGITVPVSMSKIRAKFGGTGPLSSYRRGGGLVPDIPVNAAISTTAAGLRISQFEGADVVALPPTPTLNYANITAVHYDAGTATAELFFRTTGVVAGRENFGGYNTLYTWLPSGRAASEYDFRYSINGGTTWSAWINLGVDRLVVDASATSDGFYSDSQYNSVLVQLGAQGTVLTTSQEFNVQADAIGRG